MFYIIHVQGQNALTTLLHLADVVSYTDLIALVSPDKQAVGDGLDWLKLPENVM